MGIAEILCPEAGSRRKIVVMGSPLISVLMPVWNGAEYLRDAVESILDQTFSSFELIVVDDGSTDSTLDILGTYTDPRLKVFRREHAGIVSALNFGVAQAQADWIARQDADDVSHPSRLESQWLSVKERPEVALCYTNFQVLDGQIVRPAPARFPRSRALVALKLCFQCPITHGTVMFRKSAFHLAGGYREEERHAEDYSLWTRMIGSGPFIAVSKVLVSLRIHRESSSRLNEPEQLRLTNEIGVRHCESFLRLNQEEARHAHEVLSASPGDGNLSGWVWFLQHCLPRMRWKSLEAYAWIIKRTLKQIYAVVRPTPKREASSGERGARTAPRQ